MAFSKKAVNKTECCLVNEGISLFYIHGIRLKRLGGKKNVSSRATFERVDTFINGMVDAEKERGTAQPGKNRKT